MFADGGTVLIDGCERYTKEVRVTDIAASHYCDIRRDAQAGIENRAHCAQGNGVVEAEDSVGSRVSGQQLPGRLISAWFATVVA